MVSLLRRNDGSVGDKREVDPGIGYQVGLELVQIHIQGSVKSKRSSDGRHDLGDQPVQVGVGRTLDIKVPKIK